MPRSLLSSYVLVRTRRFTITIPRKAVRWAVFAIALAVATFVTLYVKYRTLDSFDWVYTYCATHNCGASQHADAVRAHQVGEFCTAAYATFLFGSVALLAVKFHLSVDVFSSKTAHKLYRRLRVRRPFVVYAVAETLLEAFAVTMAIAFIVSFVSALALT